MEGNFFVKNLFAKAALDKSQALKAQGIKIDVESFNNEGQIVEIVITGKTKKTFRVSFEGNTAYLENPEHRVPGGRPVYLFEDMVTYLFILANGGPVTGKLMYPGTEEKKFFRAPAVIPT